MLRVRNRRGIAAYEFAMLAPVIVTAMVGIAEVSMTLRLKLRLESVAQQMAQVVSQCNLVNTPGDENQFWAEASKLLEGVARLEGNGTTLKGGTIILSAVYRQNGTNKVAWQLRKGDSSFISAIGAAGGAATLPAGFSPPGDHNVIVAEVLAHVPTLVVDPEVKNRVSLPASLSATSLTVSRALDPARLRQLVTNDARMACTA